MMVYLQILIGELRTRARSEEGASAVEYGLLVSLIAAVIVTAVTVLGTKVASIFSSITGAF